MYDVTGFIFICYISYSRQHSQRAAILGILYHYYPKPLFVGVFRVAYGSQYEEMYGYEGLVGLVQKKGLGLHMLGIGIGSCWTTVGAYYGLKLHMETLCRYCSSRTFNLSCGGQITVVLQFTYFHFCTTTSAPSMGV